MTIKKKIMLILLSFTLCPMIFVGGMGFITARRSIENARIENLKIIIDLKVKKIEAFFTGLKEDILIVKNHPKIKTCMLRLSGAHLDFSGAPYQKTRAELDDLLKVKQKVHQFLNVMLLNPEGRIAYVLHAAYAPGNLGELLPAHLGKAFDAGKGEVYFSDFLKNKDERLSIMITAPIHENNTEFIGVIAFEINIDSIYELILDTTGLGQTGEILIAKESGEALLFLNSLRRDMDSALKIKTAVNQNKTPPIQKALEGGQGCGLMEDYRGTAVIAAWRYIPLLKWGVVAKTDVSEAFVRANHLRNLVVVLVAIAVSFGTLIAVWVSNSVAHPIQSLQKGVEIIGRGNLDYKVGTKATDEIGRLAKAFDRMTENLKAITASRDELNREVLDRQRAEAALRESEKRFRNLVENALTGISIIQNDQIVYQNSESSGIFGSLPRKFKLLDLESIHPDDLQKVKDFYQKTSQGGSQKQTIDFDFRFFPRPNAGSKVEMKWVQCRTSRTEYEGKDSILLNIMDMTKAKELEHLLGIQDKMASLGRVAAGIAHEIRNPLSGINVHLNTLEKIFDQAESMEKVKTITGQLFSASNKIESVIRKVMDFSKPKAPSFQLTNLNQPIEEAINLSAVTLRKRGIKIEKNLHENLPLCETDPHMIEQVILNLITNAAESMKSMDDNEKKIGVASAADNSRIILKVFDSGSGIPLAIKDRIFDPFYTTKSGSTGIGLSIVHRIVTDHGGSLSVHKSKWGGAEFKIEIPIQRRRLTGAALD